MLSGAQVDEFRIMIFCLTENSQFTITKKTTPYDPN